MTAPQATALSDVDETKPPGALLLLEVRRLERANWFSAGAGRFRANELLLRPALVEGRT